MINKIEHTTTEVIISKCKMSAADVGGNENSKLTNFWEEQWGGKSLCEGGTLIPWVGMGEEGRCRR